MRAIAILILFPLLFLIGCSSPTKVVSRSAPASEAHLVGGYPQKEAIAGIYDELDFQRAVQA
jgi:hypothetical protein